MSQSVESAKIIYKTNIDTDINHTNNNFTKVVPELFEEAEPPHIELQSQLYNIDGQEDLVYQYQVPLWGGSRDQEIVLNQDSDIPHTNIRV